MLKYLNAKQTFLEVPDEISLCINITGCPIHCKGCHSQFLWEDTGEFLTFTCLKELIEQNDGISCVCFMGGVQDPKYLNKLATYIRDFHSNLKIAWYSGLDFIPEEINLKNFDYIKLGPYIEEKGGLDNPKTNQIFLRIEHEFGKNFKIDITSKFWKHE